MLDWRHWCRLCGGYEINEQMEQEVVEIVEQIIDVSLSFDSLHTFFQAFFQNFFFPCR